MIAGMEWRRGLLLVVTAGLRASGSDWRRGLERATSSRSLETHVCVLAVAGLLLALADRVLVGGVALSVE